MDHGTRTITLTHMFIMELSYVLGATYFASGKGYSMYRDGGLARTTELGR